MHFNRQTLQPNKPVLRSPIFVAEKGFARSVQQMLERYDLCGKPTMAVNQKVDFIQSPSGIANPHCQITDMLAIIG